MTPVTSIIGKMKAHTIYEILNYKNPLRFRRITHQKQNIFPLFSVRQVKQRQLYFDISNINHNQFMGKLRFSDRHVLIQIQDTDDLRPVLQPIIAQQKHLKMGSNGININGKVIFSTGNIMSINDITKKPSQSSTQELIDAIKYTLKEYTKTGDSAEHADHSRIISRADDIQVKIQENGLEDLKIGLKVFLTNDNETLLKEAIDTALQKQLNVNYVADIIVSFKKGLLEDRKDDLDEIKKIWKNLESYVENGVVGELGIADIEESTFRALYDWSTVKPSIIQINLATCCVVPPTLQAFCKEKNIKLFTHSDSSDILPDHSIEDIFGKSLDLQWAVRFTIHIKCRGVLTTKGYCLCLSSK